MQRPPPFPPALDTVVLNMPSLRLALGTCIIRRPMARLIFEQFRGRLSRERGLTCATIGRHELVVPCLVRERCGDTAKGFRELRSVDILEFITHPAGDGSPRSTQLLCSTLRQFLRYLYYRGYIRTALPASVPELAQGTGVAQR